MTGVPKREPDDRLADWVDGRMTARERERFAAELRVSAHLRNDLAEYEKTVAAVRAALQAPTHPTNLAERVMARIAADAAAPKQTRIEPRAARWWNHPATWSLASAAAVLLVALLVNSWSDGRAAVPTAMVAEETKDDAAADRGRGVPLDEMLGVERKVEAKDPQRDSVTTATAAVPPREGAPGTLLGAQKPPATAPGDHPETKADGETGTWEKEAAAGAPSRTEGPSTMGPTGPTAPPKGGVYAPDASPPAVGVQPRPEGDRGVFGENNERSDLLEVADGKDQDQAEALQGTLQKQANAREGKNHEKAGAEKRGVENPGARGSTGKSVPDPSREVLALVVLQGDALDVAPVVRRAGVDKDADKDADKGGGGAKTKSGDTSSGRNSDGSAASRGEGAAAAAAAALDAFFAEQMRSVAPSADAPRIVIGSVTVRPIGAEAARVVSATPAPAAPSPTADALKADSARTPIERTFVVEGTKEEVAFLLRRLASFARAGNLHLTNGETSVPRSPLAMGETGVPVPDPSATGSFGAGFVQVTPTTRVVLRFRVLRR